MYILKTFFKLNSHDLQQHVQKILSFFNVKMREKILLNPRTFFVFVLYCTKSRCSQIEPQLKVKIEDWNYCLQII